MTAPRVLALDLSLTATGVALPDGRSEVWSTTAADTRRLHWFAQQTDSLMLHITDLVVIEGHAFSSRASQTHALGELAGVVKLAVWRTEVPLVEVPPANLKKYATGKGNASKGEVLVAAVKRLGYEGHSDDEADALWLRAMALDHYGHAVCDMPAVNRKALDKIDWPDLEVAP